ncbi:MAG: alkaline phosphatase family protein [Chloroflexota bacterium]
MLARLAALGIGAGFSQTLLGAPPRALAAPPIPSHAPYVVVVVMDAFRYDYQHLAHMPNLVWLMKRGVHYEKAWVGHLESYTPASHATISTGAKPAHSGVLGFDWRDPATGEETYTGWYRDVIQGKLEQQLTQHGVNSIPIAMKRQDPHARVVALSSEKYYAADAMGGAAADFILYGMHRGHDMTVHGLPHHVPPQSYLNQPDLKRPWPLVYGQFDDLSMSMALDSLRPLDPRLLMINLPGPDIYGHRVGGPASPDVMKVLVAGCDVQLGRLFRAFENNGRLDQTIFVVTADHGMVPNHYMVADQTIKRGVRESGGQYLFHTGGNCAYIFLKNPVAAPGVAQHLVDTIAPAPFAHVQSIQSGQYVYTPVPRTGTTIDPALEDAYQYLLGTFAGPLAPDIALSFEENTITRTYTSAHGEHGAATWGAQHVPLVIAGPGVKRAAHSKYPARLMDIAPTVLRLLGIEPTNMDGAVLADALINPTAADVQAQDLLAGPQHAHQRAIIKRSNEDIRSEG